MSKQLWFVLAAIVSFIVLASDCGAKARAEGKLKPTPLAILAYLDGEVSDVTVQPAIDAIDRANDIGNRVILEINSGGGDIDAGFRLVKAIERAKRPVACITDGHAYSMASYVFESCPIRVMTRRSVLMIHEAGQEETDGGGLGHPYDFQNTAEELTAISLAMFSFYAHRIPGLAIGDIAARTRGSRCIWLYWKDAMAIGAIDRVVDSVKEVK